jgi:hypothetical protein
VTALGDLVGVKRAIGAQVGAGRALRRLEAQAVDLVPQVARQQMPVDLGRDARVAVAQRCTEAEFATAIISRLAVTWAFVSR